jgi:hypothetical protein
MVRVKPNWDHRTHGAARWQLGRKEFVLGRLG